jgi:predicted DNA-binding WGR domain protein
MARVPEYTRTLMVHKFPSREFLESLLLFLFNTRTQKGYVIARAGVDRKASIERRRSRYREVA